MAIDTERPVNPIVSPPATPEKNNAEEGRVNSSRAVSSTDSNICCAVNLVESLPSLEERDMAISRSLAAVPPRACRPHDSRRLSSSSLHFQDVRRPPLR